MILLIIEKLELHPLHFECDVMGEIISFFLKKIFLSFKFSKSIFFGKFSISSVAQLVERLPLDLVDPVQMGSQGEVFFSFFHFHFILTTT